MGVEEPAVKLTITAKLTQQDKGERMGPAVKEIMDFLTQTFKGSGAELRCLIESAGGEVSVATHRPNPGRDQPTAVAGPPQAVGVPVPGYTAGSDPGDCDKEGG